MREIRFTPNIESATPTNKQNKSSDKMKYTVQSYSEYAVDQCGGNVNHITGFDSEREADSIKEAKRIAKYMLSEECRISNEASECAAYVQIIDRSGDCVHDEFRKGYSVQELAPL